MKNCMLFAGAIAAAAISSSARAGDSPSASPATVRIEVGRMLFDMAGRPIGAIYRMTPRGDPQLILDDRLRTVPVSTISQVGRKLTTSLTRTELMRRK